MRAFSILAAALVFSFFYSCKDVSEQSHMDNMAKMKDSIFKSYPTVASVSMNVEDRTKLIITLGDRHLYKATEAHRQEMNNELGAMAVRIFGKGTDLKEEDLIITQDERNTEEKPKDGLKTTIAIDSLIKAGK